MNRILTLIFLFAGTGVFAQAFVGPAYVTPNQIVTYSVTDNTNGGFVSPSWAVTNGTKQSSSISADRFTAYVTIKWKSTTGTGSIQMQDGDMTYGPQTINIISCPVMGQPTNLSSTALCTGQTSVLTATPGSNGNSIQWFKSATDGLPVATGTSYTTPALSAATTYYAQSFNTTSNCYSARVSITVTPNTTPPGPTAFSWAPVMVSGSAVLYANAADFGASYVNRWYTTAVGGTYTTGPSYTTPVISTPTTFYVTTYNPTNGCESARYGFSPEIIAATGPASVTKFSVRAEGITLDSLLYKQGSDRSDSTLIYMDGLLRPIQTVAKKSSFNGYDLVQPVEYDAFGRTSKDYLPYASTTQSGSYRSSYQTQQASFYTSGVKVAHDNAPYAVANYELSPLGRKTEQGAPGQSWQPGTGHTSLASYSYNNGATADQGEEVRKFNADGTSSGFYAVNTLSRTQGTDANGHITIVYADGAGRTIAKKQQLGSTINGAMVNYLETYYIYNDLNQLVYIIPPKAVAQLKPTWSVTPAFLNLWCFQFVYDKRGRVTQKKSPGQAAVYITYDKLNRAVLVQDGFLRTTNQWRFVKYDIKERTVMSGLYTDNVNNTLALMQSVIDGLYQAGNGTFPPSSYGETRGTSLQGYTNISFPQTNQDGSALSLQSVAYYDNYDFDNSGTDDKSYVPQTLTNEGAQARAVGFATGSKTLVLGTSTWLSTYVFYDKYGRTIQSQSNNFLSSAIDNLTTVTYDPVKGTVYQTKTYHNAGGTNQTTVLQTPTYDSKGRVTQVSHSINNAAAQVVAQYQYNELGQLVTKQLHKNADNSFVQTVDLLYNIRGWLTNINDAQLSDPNDYFGLELFYNNTETSSLNNSPVYDGNLSAVKWKGVWEHRGHRAAQL